MNSLHKLYTADSLLTSTLSPIQPCSDATNLQNMLSFQPGRALHEMPLVATMQTTPINTKRKRTRFNKKQVSVLEETFNKTRYPSVHVVNRLADLLTVAKDRLHVWFQNRRQKEKKNVRKSIEEEAKPSVQKELIGNYSLISHPNNSTITTTPQSAYLPHVPIQQFYSPTQLYQQQQPPQWPFYNPYYTNNANYSVASSSYMAAYTPNISTSPSYGSYGYY